MSNKPHLQTIPAQSKTSTLLYLPLMLCSGVLVTHLFSFFQSTHWKQVLFYLTAWTLFGRFLPMVREGSTAKKKQHYPQPSSAACAVRYTAQRRWWLVSVWRCVALGQHQYQLRCANKPKTGGRRRNTGGVCNSSGAGASGRRHGGPEGEPEPEEQVSLMGDAVLGRSVQRKEEEEKLRRWGVRGCCTGVLFIWISVCQVEGELYVVHAVDDFVVDVSVKQWGTGGAGGGSLGAASLASTNITQSSSMNGLFTVGQADTEETQRDG